ncbi:beta-phosphoglucomutase [Pseudorhodoferax sp. Leaf267]|nr:beta-phosphoglucomutase [Pseudorhodoferax sp. Leaf267]
MRFTHAFIFDLDGVITDTATQHLQAWHNLALEIGVPFDPQMGEKLKGLSRMDSLELLLAGSKRHFDDRIKQQFADRKNAAYVQSLARMSAADLLPGALDALQAVRAGGWGLALASASKNAMTVLDRLGIAHLFHHVVDAARIARGKPDPETFLAAAQALDVFPTRCIGIEDAVAGVQSIRSAGMFAVGIGSAEVLGAADLVLPDLTALQPEALLRRLP